MTTPTWFKEQDYLESKLSQLKKLDSDEFGSWTTEMVMEAIEGTGLTPYQHFEAYNKDEGTSPNEFFNAYEYIEAKVKKLNDANFEGHSSWTHEQVKNAMAGVGGAWVHFLGQGYKEGINPSNAFSLKGYYEVKAEALGEPWTADLVEEHFIEHNLNALAHWFEIGNTEEGVDVVPVPEDEAVDPEPGPGPGPEPEPEPGETFSLTAGQDFREGTAGNDLFKANVVQNAMGAQVNSLGSGDELDGGAGYDTLDAKITSGVFAGGSVTMPIQPETKNIELVKLQAVIADIAHPDNSDGLNNDQVYLNAKDMVGVKKISSNYSDADLTIMNLTSKGNTHVSDMTVGMEYTGNADSRWEASDLSVYFDQDYLSRTENSRDGLYYELMNQATWDADTSGSREFNLIDFPLTEVIFRVDGVRKALDVRAEMAEGASPEIDTYAKLVDLLNSKIAATYPEYVGKLAFETNGLFSDQENLREGTIIELVNTDLELMVTAPSIALDTERPAGNLYWDFGLLEEIVTQELVSINVDLEKVGLTGLGGSLVIGSMNKGSDLNTWNAVDSVTDTVSGIEQFDVTVHGTNDKSSWLKELRSTNNQLREVNIKSAGGRDGNWADLVIGVSDDAGLRDLLTLNATAFMGDLVVAAEITADIADKYLDEDSPLLEDLAALGSENAEKAIFNYDGGFGDDVFELAINGVAVADSYADAFGTSFRSFNLNINGNDGNDAIDLAFDDVSTPNTVILETDAVPADWEEQTVAWSGISVSGGAGDDLIWLDNQEGTVTLVTSGGSTVSADVDGGLWSFAVVFDQGVSRLANGSDTIVDFNVGVQTFTREVQTLDFANYGTDGGNQGSDGLNVVLHDGEWLNLTIEGKVYSYVATADMTAVDVAGLSSSDFVSNLNPNSGATTPASVGLDTLGYEFGNDSTNEPGVLYITAPAKDWVAAETAGTLGAGDIQTITSYVDHLDEDHHNSIELSSVRLEGPDGTTLVQGGYAQTGADFLDFTSYNVKGVVWQNFDITGSVETLDTVNSGIITEEFGSELVAGDTLIYVREAQHREGFYDIYHARVITDGDFDLADVTATDLFDETAGVPDYLTGVTLIGSAQFVNDFVESQQNFDATNFLF